MVQAVASYTLDWNRLLSTPLTSVGLENWVNMEIRIKVEGDCGAMLKPRVTPANKQAFGLEWLLLVKFLTAPSGQMDFSLREWFYPIVSVINAHIGFKKTGMLTGGIWECWQQGCFGLRKRFLHGHFVVFLRKNPDPRGGTCSWKNTIILYREWYEHQADE